MTTTPNVVVIGIGSPFGADTLGWQVIEQLKSRQSTLNNYIRLETCDRPGTLLLEYMKGVRKVILIDALEGGTPGNIKTLTKEELLQQHSLQSSHQLGVAETITLGEILGLLPEDLVLLGINIGHSSETYNFSPEVINKIADTVAKETNIRNCDGVSIESPVEINYS